MSMGPAQLPNNSDLATRGFRTSAMNGRGPGHKLSQRAEYAAMVTPAAGANFSMSAIGAAAHKGVGLAAGTKFAELKFPSVVPGGRQMLQAMIPKPQFPRAAAGFAALAAKVLRFGI